MAITRPYEEGLELFYKWRKAEWKRAGRQSRQLLTARSSNCRPTERRRQSETSQHAPSSTLLFLYRRKSRKSKNKKKKKKKKTRKSRKKKNQKIKKEKKRKKEKQSRKSRKKKKSRKSKKNKNSENPKRKSPENPKRKPNKSHIKRWKHHQKITIATADSAIDVD